MIGTLAISSNAIAPKISDLQGQTEKVEDNTSLPKYLFIAEIYASEAKRISYIPMYWVKEHLKQVLAQEVANKGGNYYLLYECIKHESQFDPLAKGDGGLAIGPAQIHLYYWNKYCEGNRYNPYDNLQCFVKQNVNQKDPSWSCWKLIIN